MERAQREADGPKRRIIEAAKAREKAVAKAEATPLRAKTALEAAPSASAPKPLVAASVSAPVLASISPPVAASPSVPAARAAPALDAPGLAGPSDGTASPAASLAPAQPVATPAPMPLPMPTPPAAASSQAEEAYALDLNRLVDGLKRYPTSREARALRPQGTVQLWLEVDRSGLLLQAGLAASSGAPLLDGEALRSVRVGRYAPFPDGAFEGQPSRRFLVAIEYRYDGA
jgi:protein TonB